jgi:two-component system NtrC family sensor kinase
MRLRTKLLLLLTLATMPPLVALLFYSGYLGSRTLVEQVDRDMQVLLQRGQAEIESLLTSQKAAARALSEVPTLHAFLDAYGGKAAYAPARQDLEDYFLAYQQAKPSVQAVRVLDRRGNTLVKVKEGAVVPPEKAGPDGVAIVGRQGGKQYFQQARRLDAGEVGISNFELGRVSPDSDFCPAMIRYMTPLVRDGRRLGYLVVNGWGRRLDQVLAGLMPERKGSALLVEHNRTDPRRDGIFLYHPEEDQRFANQQASSAFLGVNLGEEVSRRVKAQDQGVVALPSADQRFYFNRFSPYDDPTHGWVLGIRAHTAALLGPTNTLQASIAGVGALALLALLLLSRWAAASVTRPIHRLAGKVRCLAEGDLSVRCRTDRPDEVGSLARSFDYLADSLEQAQQERDEAEQQARQAAKLASVGELAGGLAHEINNPLNNIQNLAQLVERDLPPEASDRIRRDLATLRQECEQCGRIVQGMLNFGRQTAPEFRSVALPELVDQTLTLLERKARSARVRIRREADPAGGAVVWADPHQLQQVLVNTLLNAIQASPAGGEIAVNLREGDGRVTVEIRDQGPGIVPEAREKIFDPFFTTKPEGEGSGLGLSVSYGILKRHHGEIRVDSQPGEGTRVSLELPAHGPSADEAPAIPASPEMARE